MKKLKILVFVAVLLVSSFTLSACLGSDLSMAELNEIFNSSMEVTALDMTFNIDVNAKVLNGRYKGETASQSVKSRIKMIDGDSPIASACITEDSAYDTFMYHAYGYTYNGNEYGYSYAYNYEKDTSFTDEAEYTNPGIDMAAIESLNPSVKDRGNGRYEITIKNKDISQIFDFEAITGTSVTTGDMVMNMWINKDTNFLNKMEMSFTFTTTESYYDSYVLKTADISYKILLTIEILGVNDAVTVDIPEVVLNNLYKYGNPYIISEEDYTDTDTVKYHKIGRVSDLIYDNTTDTFIVLRDFDYYDMKRVVTVHVYDSGFNMLHTFKFDASVQTIDCSDGILAIACRDHDNGNSYIVLYDLESFTEIKKIYPNGNLRDLAIDGDMLMYTDSFSTYYETFLIFYNIKTDVKKEINIKTPDTMQINRREGILYVTNYYFGKYYLTYYNSKNGEILFNETSDFSYDYDGKYFSIWQGKIYHPVTGEAFSPDGLFTSEHYETDSFIFYINPFSENGPVSIYDKNTLSLIYTFSFSNPQAVFYIPQICGETKDGRAYFLNAYYDQVALVDLNGY